MIESECESKIFSSQICICLRSLFVPCYELDMRLSRLVSHTLYDLLHQEYFVIVICELRPVHIEAIVNIQRTFRSRISVGLM